MSMTLAETHFFDIGQQTLDMMNHSRFIKMYSDDDGFKIDYAVGGGITKTIRDSCLDDLLADFFEAVK